MNKINTYGYAVYRLAGGQNPAHIVAVKHEMLAAFAVFNTASDARQYIAHEKTRLEQYGGLAYDADFSFADYVPSLISLYTSGEETTGFFTDLQQRRIFKR